MRTFIAAAIISTACLAAATSAAGPLPDIFVQDPVIRAPLPIPAGHPVTITSRIHSASGSPQVIPGGVYLLRLDAANRLQANLGVMHDDGVDGDAIADDGVFSLRVIAPETLDELRVQVSAPFSGMSRRIVTNASCAPIVRNRRPVADAGPDRLNKAARDVARRLQSGR